MVRRILPPDPRLEGREPDYRFTLANERTFLAWVRTALSLAAGGLGVITILPEVAGAEYLGLLLLALAAATSVTAYRRWAINERAMRLGEKLPATVVPQMMAAGTALVAVVAAVVLLVDRL